MNKPITFIVHSINKKSGTVLLELNSRVMNDLHDSINETMGKLEVYYPDEVERIARLKKYRDELLKILPQL